MNPIAKEPVLTAYLAAVVAWLVAKLGFDLTAEQASAIAGAVLTVLVPFVRQLVWPDSKVRARPQEPVAQEPAGPPVTPAELR